MKPGRGPTAWALPALELVQGITADRPAGKLGVSEYHIAAHADVPRIEADWVEDCPGTRDGGLTGRPASQMQT